MADAALSDFKWFSDELYRLRGLIPQIRHLSMQVQHRCETLQKQMQEVRRGRSRP